MDDNNLRSVGIITKMSKNYGAVLQAFALKKIIENNGNPVQIINYNGAIGNQTYDVFLRKFSFHNTIVNMKRIKHYRSLKKSTEKFQEFRRNNFNLTAPFYSIADFRENPPKFDTYVVGSDQVWNPNILYTPIYFLDFGRKESRRVAYAASFGNGAVPVDFLNEMQAKLFCFDAISVREKSGLSILSTMNTHGKVVLDPTLVLKSSDWSYVAKKIEIGQPYILCYFLHYDKKIDSIVAKIKERFSCIVINIATNVELPSIGDKQMWDVGPDEFVGLFKNAKAVITSSFHGTVFSILFKRPFVTVNMSSKDTRLRDMLEDLCLDNQLIELDNIIIPSLDNIDYKQAYSVLEKKRVESKEFLVNNL